MPSAVRQAANLGGWATHPRRELAGDAGAVVALRQATTAMRTELRQLPRLPPTRCNQEDNDELHPAASAILVLGASPTADPSIGLVKATHGLAKCRPKNDPSADENQNDSGRLPVRFVLVMTTFTGCHQAHRHRLGSLDDRQTRTTLTGAPYVDAWYRRREQTIAATAGGREERASAASRRRNDMF